ncbi:MFS transporter [Catenulispora subtropica]|uniref:MFS transporter n=2 Tax=Catenulispora subtropica TaxID=450798 RepID=A0ABN2SQB3_9ACTN
MSEASAIPATAAPAPAVPADAAASLRRNRGFMLFWAGQSVSQFGDQITALALPLIAVARLHASTFAVSVLTAVSWMPALFGAAAGTWMDRNPNKRALMLGADLGRAAVLVSLPAVVLFGHVTLLQLYLVALLVGIFSMVFNTTHSAFFARLVPRESYIAANSRLSASQSAAYVAGPAMGGALIQALSAPVAVLADAGSFLTSAAFIWRIRSADPTPDAATDAVPDEAPDARAEEKTPRSFRGELKQGWAFVTYDPVVRASLAGTTTINFFTFLAGTGLVVLFATRTLGLSAGTIGATLGVGATGSLVGALVASRVAARLGVGRTVAVGAVLFPAPFALAALAGGPIVLRVGLIGAAEFFIGLGVMLFDINQNAILTAAVPDGMRSRVSGVYSSVNYGVRPLAALIGGLLAAHAGLRATFLTAAVGGSLSVLWFLASPIPRITTLDALGAASTRTP